MIKNVTNVEFRSTIHILGQFLMVEANREIVSSFNPNVNSDTSRVRDIYRMKLKFHRSKVDEDPQRFIHEVYKVLYTTGVSWGENKIVAY